MITKTEVVQTRITPKEKIKIDNQIAKGRYKTKSELYNTALNLFINDDSGLFKSISDHYNEYFVCLTHDQYEQAKVAYHDLQGALHALTVLTDDYTNNAPFHYKNMLRDFLIPRLYASLKQYEDTHDVDTDLRVTD